MIKKITFITFHNWETKRHGGFHALADYTSRQGIETVFFSFPRPYHIWFTNRKKNERLNRSVLRDLSRGKEYKVGASKIINITWPTLSFPYPWYRLIPKALQKWLVIHSFISFKKIVDKWLFDSDCFVFESNESILLLDKIKQLFPKSLIIYRSSDPIIEHESYYRDEEIRILKKADLVLAVNQECVDLYRSKIPDFDTISSYKILSNGVDLADYSKVYMTPKIIENKKSAVFIGANPNIEWPLLFEASRQLSNILFIVINPRTPPKLILDKLNDFNNLIYIPGIPSNEVAHWVTNCTICINPLTTDYYLRRPVVQITAKMLKAMAAKKPFVSYCDSPKLSKFGITTTYTYSDFINVVKNEINISGKEYNINLQEYDWEIICSQFLSYISNLKTLKD